MADPLNVLFLMTDQHRTDTLPCYGNSVVRAPNLDRIASNGTCFDRFYTPTAICTPARASLFTGVHPFRHGLFVNPERAGGAQAEVPENLTVLSEPLRRAGYRMGHAGKWHIGRDRGPEFYGIDGEHLPGALNPFTHPLYEKWLVDNDFPLFAVKDPIYGRAENGSGRGHLIAGRLQQPAEATMERFITEQALELLRGYASGGADDGSVPAPFWLTCSWFGPHLPYLIPDEYYDMYDPALVELPGSMAETFDGKPPVQRHYSEYWSADSFDTDEWRKLIAVYWGYVTLIDDCVGLLLDELERLGLDQRTAIMFTADHGEFTGAHRLNDKGPAMYEDIYRIPGLVCVPGRPAQRRSEFASLVDIAPTILDLAGAEPVEAHDGRSLTPLLAGAAPDEIDPAWREQIVAEFHGHHFPHSQRMLRDDRYKLVYNPESVHELYDLELDPYELHNLYTVPSYRAVRDDLELRLYAELVDRGDPAYTWMTYMTHVGEERAPDVDGVADAVAPGAATT
ncbi:sulfatase-like hydrolase/transferase [Flexivirga alba]|uniref:Sulfatase-like hydrolase/transferase n=1 Tax=Flexivirga alba TaxID=702742 RepID=A0ABW2ACH3_9MICO